MGVIEVSDTGEGMSPKMLETLFSRSGIKKSNTDAENSSGLGLYIAKNFMQMQGGDITVTSKVGKGTTFAYTLKLATEKNIENFKTHKDVQDNELSDEANGEKTQNPVY
jgi:signal transduction histidine kinase